jgi:hypothetical protein
MRVSGMVTAQYNRNCGVVLIPISPPSACALSQSKRSVEKRAEMKLPGKKNIVTNASVFMDAASRRVDIEMI